MKRGNAGTDHFRYGGFNIQTKQTAEMEDNGKLNKQVLFDVFSHCCSRVCSWGVHSSFSFQNMDIDFNGYIIAVFAAA